MGQAKRRKQQLGDRYGTPEHSAQPAVTFRWMTPDEIASIRSDGVLPDDRLQYIAAEQGQHHAWLIIRPLMDQYGQVNSEVAIHYPKDAPRGWLQGDWRRHHRELNRFMVVSSDVVIVNG
jgi:hypothetical protein